MCDISSVPAPRLPVKRSGIPKDHLTHVFDPFFTPPFLERAGFTTKHGGTDLGLSVVQGIIKEHGGKIRIESQSGEGTRVRLELPLAQG